MSSVKDSLSTIGQDMLAAAKTSLSAGKWRLVRDYAELEFQNLQTTAIKLAEMFATGKINEDRAQAHIRLQQSSFKTMLLTVQGIGLVEVEKMLNAAIKAVLSMVNSKVGFTLLRQGPQ